MEAVEEGMGCSESAHSVQHDIFPSLLDRLSRHGVKKVHIKEPAELSLSSLFLVIAKATL